MIKIEHPFVDPSGVSHEDLIKTYTDDGTKVLLQLETGLLYKEALDKFPCKYTYKEIDDPESELTAIEE